MNWTLLVTMGSCKYLFVLFTFIIPSCLDSTEGALWQEEEAAEKFIALEDNLHFHKQLGKFNKDYGEKWIVMPDGNGSALFALMDAKSPGTAKSLPSLTSEKTAEHVKLFLHTPEQKEGVVFNAYDLDKIQFNPSNPTRIICHGWMASTNSTVITNIRDAYLANNRDNVIAVDWSSLANDIFYPSPAKFTHSVGQYIGSVIDNLVDTHKARYSDFHIIGHSLGAHVAGFAGSSTREKIGRITGLDPALPGFQYVQGRDGRLDNTDAAFVDVIHTCSGLLGISIPAGHVDFYPNGGSPYQPGCCGNPLPTTTQACSHSRSHEFFAESINKKSQFSAIKCNDWDHFKHHNCEKVYAMMGEHVSRDANGVFYLKTNDMSPFAKGLNVGKFSNYGRSYYFGFTRQRPLKKGNINWESILLYPNPAIYDYLHNNCPENYQIIMETGGDLGAVNLYESFGNHTPHYAYPQPQQHINNSLLSWKLLNNGHQFSVLDSLKQPANS